MKYISGAAIPVYVIDGNGSALGSEENPINVSVVESGGVSDTKYAIIDVASSGNNTIVAAVPGKQIRVTSVTIIASAAVTIRFESAADGTALTGQMQLAANGGF